MILTMDPNFFTFSDLSLWVGFKYKYLKSLLKKA